MSAAASTAPDFRTLAWPRETERLVLRPAEPEDAAALWEHRGLPEVGAWLGWRPENRDDWDAQYATKHSDYLVVLRDGQIIGDLKLTVTGGWAQREVAEDAVGTQAEIGWTFHPGHTGRGYATEAVEALICICFEALGLRRVEAAAFLDNEPSWKLMERVGMRRETHGVRDSLHRDLGWIDGVLYAMLADEWRAAQNKGRHRFDT